MSKEEKKEKRVAKMSIEGKRVTKNSLKIQTFLAIGRFVSPPCNDISAFVIFLDVDIFTFKVSFFSEFY